jgi:hypothetical protein
MSRLLLKSIAQPVLAPMLSGRRLAVILASLATVQTILAAAEMPGWRCPLQTLVGIPCPTCGLSHATAMLCKGQWCGAIHMHAFAPIMLGGMLILFGLALLPSRSRTVLIAAIDRVERRTALVPVLAAAMILYWFLRQCCGVF